MSDEYKVDYHIHTYYSDGCMSPTEVVKRFKEEGYDIIAITDHDGVSGVAEAQIAGNALDIRVIPGIELSTRDRNGIGFHILGYNIDIDNNELLNRLEEIRVWREERNRKIIDELAMMGYPLDEEDLIMRKGQDFIGKPIFARALVNRGYIENVKEAFSEKFFGSDRLRKIKKHVISTEEAIELIKKASGTPVLAHPGMTRGIGERGSREFYSNMDKAVRALKKKGLGGIECYYPGHTREETLRFVELAEKYHLHVTKGSDFHDPELIEG